MDKLLKWIVCFVGVFVVANLWSYFMLDNKKPIWELVVLSATIALVNVLYATWEDRMDRKNKK